MASVQSHTLAALTETSQKLSGHIETSQKQLETVTTTRDARIAQLSVLQQDLRYIFEALRRMQRLCDSAQASKSGSAPASLPKRA